MDPSRDLRILLVDDDEVDRMAVRRALGGAGVAAEYREAADAGSALAALRAEAFDCAFLDFQLPDGDGLRVLREAREAGVHTPIVALTGHEDTETAVALVKAGASDYLAKGSVNGERLARALATAIRIGEAEAAARAAERARNESESRLRRIGESGMIGLLFWDVGGRVTEANDVFLELVGRTRAELEAGRIDWRRITPPEWEAVDQAALEELRDRGFARPFEKEFFHAGGHRVPVLLSAATFEGTADQGVTLVLDITGRKRAEREREHALSSRNRFYAAMSHELRTPINAILGYNDLLLTGVYGALGAEQEHGVQRSQRAARHLLDLVNDVLDLSKLEAGKMELAPEAVGIVALVEDLFATVRPLAETHGSALRLVPEERDPVVVTDPRRVRQVILNLLSNALKFGRGRPVEVRVAATPGGGAAVAVQDEGEGIAPEHMDRIFEEFMQLPNSLDGGTGLGLPISRRLAELLGGYLEVDSRPGEGSTFRLVLPPVLPGAGGLPPHPAPRVPEAHPGPPAR